METNAVQAEKQETFVKITKNVIKVYNRRMEKMKSMMGKDNDWTKQNSSRKLARSAMQQARRSGLALKIKNE